MGVDYYNVLKVAPTATSEEIKKAYKRLAIVWHPDKNLNNKDSEAMFKKISEAHDVLIDPVKRRIYDLKGEDGLQGCEFGEFNDDVSYGSDDEHRLACSLDELYLGCEKKLKVSRIASNDFGQPCTVHEILSIDVKPGWKKGTKITFPQKGKKGSLVFVIEEKPHANFSREGNDLVCTQRVTLSEALTGKTLCLLMLDGRVITIPVSDVVSPDYVKVIPGEGMPLSREPKKKGDLKIKFDIKFPSRLSSIQKFDLRRVLAGS